ncbi:hypothetical protein HMPREF0058_1883, partial [Actinomyces urogenitalis DSM 15434]
GEAGSLPAAPAAGSSFGLGGAAPAAPTAGQPAAQPSGDEVTDAMNALPEDLRRRLGLA